MEQVMIFLLFPLFMDSNYIIEKLNADLSHGYSYTDLGIVFSTLFLLKNIQEAFMLCSYIWFKLDSIQYADKTQFRGQDYALS